MRVMVTNDRSTLAVSITATGSGNSWAKNFPSAASQALAARETSSRTPMPTTIAGRPDPLRVLQLPEHAPEPEEKGDDAKIGGARSSYHSRNVSASSAQTTRGVRRGADRR